MLRTLISFVVFNILLAIPPVLLLVTGSNQWILPQFWGIFIMLNGLTFILLFSVTIVQKRMPALYAQTFLGATIVKMLGSMIFALLLVKKIHANQAVFLANFFYIYFLNAGFEVYVLLRNLRNQI